MYNHLEGSFSARHDPVTGRLPSTEELHKHLLATGQAAREADVVLPGSVQADVPLLARGVSGNPVAAFHQGAGVFAPPVSFTPLQDMIHAIMTDRSAGHDAMHGLAGGGEKRVVFPPDKALGHAARQEHLARTLAALHDPVISSEVLAAGTARQASGTVTAAHEAVRHDADDDGLSLRFGFDEFGSDGWGGGGDGDYQPFINRPFGLNGGGRGGGGTPPMKPPGGHAWSGAEYDDKSCGLVNGVYYDNYGQPVDRRAVDLTRTDSPLNSAPNAKPFYTQKPGFIADRQGARPGDGWDQWKQHKTGNDGHLGFGDRAAGLYHEMFGGFDPLVLSRAAYRPDQTVYQGTASHFMPDHVQAYGDHLDEKTPRYGDDLISSIYWRKGMDHGPAIRAYKEAMAHTDIARYALNTVSNHYLGRDMTADELQRHMNAMGQGQENLQDVNAALASQAGVVPQRLEDLMPTSSDEFIHSNDGCTLLREEVSNITGQPLSDDQLAHYQTVYGERGSLADVRDAARHHVAAEEAAAREREKQAQIAKAQEEAAAREREKQAQIVKAQEEAAAREREKQAQIVKAQEEAAAREREKQAQVKAQEEAAAREREKQAQVKAEDDARHREIVDRWEMAQREWKEDFEAFFDAGIDAETSIDDLFKPLPDPFASLTPEEKDRLKVQWQEQLGNSLADHGAMTMDELRNAESLALKLGKPWVWENWEELNEFQRCNYFSGISNFMYDGVENTDQKNELINCTDRIKLIIDKGPINKTFDDILNTKAAWNLASRYLSDFFHGAQYVTQEIARDFWQAVFPDVQAAGRSEQDIKLIAQHEGDQLSVQSRHLAQQTRDVFGEMKAGYAPDVSLSQQSLDRISFLARDRERDDGTIDPAQARMALARSEEMKTALREALSGMKDRSGQEMGKMLDAASPQDRTYCYEAAAQSMDRGGTMADALKAMVQTFQELRDHPVPENGLKPYKGLVIHSEQPTRASVSQQLSRDDTPFLTRTVLDHFPVTEEQAAEMQGQYVHPGFSRESAIGVEQMYTGYVPQANLSMKRKAELLAADRQHHLTEDRIRKARFFDYAGGNNMSGVTIGDGIDLSQHYKSEFITWEVGPRKAGMSREAYEELRNHSYAKQILDKVDDRFFAPGMGIRGAIGEYAEYLREKTGFCLTHNQVDFLQTVYDRHILHELTDAYDFSHGAGAWKGLPKEVKEVLVNVMVSRDRLLLKYMKENKDNLLEKENINKLIEKVMGEKILKSRVDYLENYLSYNLFHY